MMTLDIRNWIGTVREVGKLRDVREADRDVDISPLRATGGLPGGVPALLFERFSLIRKDSGSQLSPTTPSASSSVPAFSKIALPSKEPSVLVSLIDSDHALDLV